MNLSKVIAELQGHLAEHGDLPVFISEDDEWNSVTNYSDSTVWHPEFMPSDDWEEIPWVGPPTAVVLFRGYTGLPGHSE